MSEVTDNTVLVEPSFRTLHGYKARFDFCVGTVGRSGAKVHLIHVIEIVGLENPDEAKAGTLAAVWLREQRKPHPQPVYYSVTSSCNANGQYTARALDNRNWSQVTCAKCRNALERLQARAHASE